MKRSWIPSVELSIPGVCTWWLLGVQFFYSKGWPPGTFPADGVHDEGIPAEAMLEVGLAVVTIRLVWTLAIPKE